ncbi:MAG: dihydropteroate synthase, partial [Planctomycetales bacterium]|nr:dihydropteroate synthase [Planctomycetales bacterium]
MTADEQHIHFVTGRLAEHAVRSIVAQVAEQQRFAYSISVLPITVAALMTPRWLLRHLQIPDVATRVLLPGHLLDDLQELRQASTDIVECGPRDIRDLPLFFGAQSQPVTDYGPHSIEIIAEINHANRLSNEELLTHAQRLVAEGADTIDLGCTPGQRWTTVGEAVERLVDLELRVSIDSFDPWEVAQACRAGASLVLSV